MWQYYAKHISIQEEQSVQENEVPTVQLDVVAVEKFVEEQKNKNTKWKTDLDLRMWYTWLEKHGETKLKDIPPAELDRLLCHLIVPVYK